MVRFISNILEGCEYTMLKFFLGFVLVVLILFSLLFISILLRLRIDDILEKKYNHKYTVTNKKIEGKVIKKDKRKILSSNGESTFFTNIDYFVKVKTKNGIYILDTKNDYLDLLIGETYTFDRIIHKDNNTGKIVKDYLSLM